MLRIREREPRDLSPRILRLWAVRRAPRLVESPARRQRQRSRPYLFSNTLAPSIVAGSIRAIDLLTKSTELRDRLEANTRFFREGMTKAGFNILPGEHPIVPIMFGEANAAARFAERMLDKGIYVIAFSYPVVPHGKARIRTQISAAHTRDDLAWAMERFTEAKRELAL